ncbi:MAG: hypothetical protein WBX27_19085 [Specibacter sp.]
MTDPTHQKVPPRDQLLAPRSQLTGTLVAFVGWVVVIVPIISMALLIFAAVTNPNSSIVTLGKVALIFLGAALLFCMIAAPHLLGQAVIHRERGMWRAALVTGVPTVCVILYVAFRWLGSAGS